jgi:acetyl esterase/lipase
MAQSPQLDRVISLIRARATAPRKSLEEDRVSYETMLSAMTVDDDISTERIGAGGVPAEWIAAPGANPTVVMLYLHGGGYVLGSMRTHRVMLAHLARACQGKVLGLDYRLAPENPFPAPVDDTLAAYRWLLAQGYDHRQIVLAGDSAGGGLVVAAMVAMRYVGESLPAAGVCLSPWVDMEATGQSFVTNAASDPSVTPTSAASRRCSSRWARSKRCSTMPGHSPHAPRRRASRSNWKSGRTCPMCGSISRPSSRKRSTPSRASASSSGSTCDIPSHRHGRQAVIPPFEAEMLHV